MEKKIIIGNWKMNPVSLDSAKDIFRKTKRIAENQRKTLTIICPPSVFLSDLKKMSRGGGPVLGAQDVFFENPPEGEGAYTGETSPSMLHGLGVRYVILGHSERRVLGETDRLVSQKVKAAIDEGLVAVVARSRVALRRWPVVVRSMI